MKRAMKKLEIILKDGEVNDDIHYDLVQNFTYVAYCVYESSSVTVEEIGELIALRSEAYKILDEIECEINIIDC